MPPFPRGVGALSQRVGAIPEALSIWMNQIVYDLRARGTDLTVLSLGEAFFQIPWFGLDSVDADRANHYSSSRGLPELRAQIAAYYAREYGSVIDPDRELLITAGSKMAIYLTLLATLDRDDEVVIHEPAWLSYPEQVRLADAVPCLVPYDVDVAELPSYFGPRTRMVILNNPNNPAGRMYDADELRALHRACRERDVELLVDEAYSDFVLDAPFVSLGAVAPDRDGATVVNSLSKNLGVSGWRIGYVVARAELIDACLKLNQHLITCAPTVLQLYLARHFEALTAATLPQARAVVEKRARIARAMERLGLSHLGGSSTFYFFVSTGDYPGSGLDLAATLLLDDGIAVVPGSAYGASTERFVRISIGTEPEERIVAALERLRSRLDQRLPDPVPAAERLRRAGFTPFERARSTVTAAGR